MIDFAISDEVSELRERVHQFVAEQVIPFEKDPRLTAHGPTEDLRNELVGLARGAGLLSVQVPKEFGGLGLDHIGHAVVLEAAGWSTLGPVAMNCAAPDEGNMNLLAKVATPKQAAQFLVPVIEGRWRSCFAMTEPDGAGSDPGLLSTTAVRDGADYLINGRKWLITGADGANTWIIMADLEDVGPTLFLSHGNQPGIELERTLDTMDRNYVRGHAVVSFKDLRVGPESVLGEEGKAFRYAQQRLVPARLTHCMRWLGAAARAQSIAVDYAKRCTAFGKPLGEHEGVGFMLAQNEIALQQSRLMIWWACWLLDTGEKARHESSMVKATVAEDLFGVADRCVQVLGGQGISDETPVGMIFRDIRAFRIYDGPTEVHKYAIARRLMS